jgi:hypothetical protein
MPDLIRGQAPEPLAEAAQLPRQLTNQNPGESRGFWRKFFHKYVVDFEGDGHVELRRSVPDAAT